MSANKKAMKVVVIDDSVALLFRLLKVQQLVEGELGITFLYYKERNFDDKSRFIVSGNKLLLFVKKFPWKEISFPTQVNIFISFPKPSVLVGSKCSGVFALGEVLEIKSEFSFVCKGFVSGSDTHMLLLFSPKKSWVHKKEKSRTSKS
jgi:hypothetical protein